MITFKIIVTIVLILGAAIYLSNSIVALTAEITKDPKAYFNPLLIMFSGICYFFIIALFMLFMTDSITKDIKPKDYAPKYELIHEPVYKKIN